MIIERFERVNIEKYCPACTDALLDDGDDKYEGVVYWPDASSYYDPMGAECRTDFWGYCPYCGGSLVDADIRVIDSITYPVEVS